jgi:YjbE family integral membrane protein
MTPDLFTAAWFSALASIVVIDLILAGDNALVIGLAARNVPPAMQRRVILWGTVGAIGVRALLTAVVVWLLKIPGFMLVGGLALVYVGWKLTHDDAKDEASVAAQSTVRGAVQTIIIADAVMGVDNVLAVGGAAHGSLLLVLIGLAVSIPIVIGGSTLVLKWVERYPAILWLGAAVIGWTAAKMIASEPLLAEMLHGRRWLSTALYVAIVGGLAGAPASPRGSSSSAGSTSVLPPQSILPTRGNGTKASSISSAGSAGSRSSSPCSARCVRRRRHARKRRSPARATDSTTRRLPRGASYRSGLRSSAPASSAASASSVPCPACLDCP